MMAALELTSDKSARTGFEGRAGALCREACTDAGLVMRAVADAMIISPPLSITKAEIDMMIERVVIALDSAQTSLKKEGLL